MLDCRQLFAIICLELSAFLVYKCVKVDDLFATPNPTDVIRKLKLHSNHGNRKLRKRFEMVGPKVIMEQ